MHYHPFILVRGAFALKCACFHNGRINLVRYHIWESCKSMCSSQEYAYVHIGIYMYIYVCIWIHVCVDDRIRFWHMTSPARVLQFHGYLTKGALLEEHLESHYERALLGDTGPVVPYLGGHHGKRRYVPWLLGRLDRWNLLARKCMPAHVHCSATVRASFLGPKRLIGFSWPA